MTGASGWGRWFDVVDQLSLEPRGEAIILDEAIRVSGDCNTFSVNSVNGGCV